MTTDVRPGAVPARPRHSRLPLLYFAVAHLSAIAAFGCLAAAPSRFLGFYEQPRMVAVVHLMTLGWITASILGALLMIAPMALRAPWRTNRLDAAVFALFAAGELGMVIHLWRNSPRGLLWAAGAVAASFLLFAARALLVLRPAPLHWGAKLPFALALLNLFVATGIGILLGLNRVIPVLGPLAFENLFAHAHMAALGWGAMMVVAAGSRLLPMLLPSAMARVSRVVAGSLLLEAGTLGLFVCLLARLRGLGLWAVVAVGGLGIFLAEVVWMARHPRPAPRARRTPDWGVLHVLQSFLYLAAACLFGLALAFAPTQEWALRYGAVYGTLGLIGFLGQIIVGAGARLLPLYAWFRAYEATGLQVQPPSPHHTPVRPLQAAVFTLWTAGVPLLAVGFGREDPAWLGAGAWALGAAVALNGAGSLWMSRRARAAISRS